MNALQRNNKMFLKYAPFVPFPKSARAIGQNWTRDLIRFRQRKISACLRIDTRRKLFRVFQTNFKFRILVYNAALLFGFSVSYLEMESTTSLLDLLNTGFTIITGASRGTSIGMPSVFSFCCPKFPTHVQICLLCPCDYYWFGCTTLRSCYF